MNTLYGIDKSVLGKNFCGPETLPHGKETLIAMFSKTCEDGQPVKLYCTALPARFYTIKASSSKNSMGKGIKPFTLQTGSGCEKLAIDIALAIANGMLGI